MDPSYFVLLILKVTSPRPLWRRSMTRVKQLSGLHPTPETSQPFSALLQFSNFPFCEIFNKGFKIQSVWSAVGPYMYCKFLFMLRNFAPFVQTDKRAGTLGLPEWTINPGWFFMGLYENRIDLKASCLGKYKRNWLHDRGKSFTSIVGHGFWIY